MKYLILLLTLLVVAGCGESEPPDITYRVLVVTNKYNGMALHTVRAHYGRDDFEDIGYFPVYAEARAECDRLSGIQSYAAPDTTELWHYCPHGGYPAISNGKRLTGSEAISADEMKWLTSVADSLLYDAATGFTYIWTFAPTTAEEE